MPLPCAPSQWPCLGNLKAVIVKNYVTVIKGKKNPSLYMEKLWQLDLIRKEFGSWESIRNWASETVSVFFFFSWYERCESEYLSEVETQNSFLDHIESLNLDLISEMKVSMVSIVLAVSWRFLVPCLSRWWSVMWWVRPFSSWSVQGLPPPPVQNVSCMTSGFPHFI